MDLFKATIDSGYEPFTDEFDRISDVTDLVTKERAAELVRFLTEYKLGNIERPEYPKDHDELLITLEKEKNENELISGIPRGTSRKHLYGFLRAAKELRKRLDDDFRNLGLDPEETSVTFLIENSGSTRGELAYHIALSTMEMVQSLDSLGVETGVIGYTTQSWNGGSARKKWIEDGSPANPGRLEDLLHIVYKRPDAPMDNLALARMHLLADPEIKKENVAGEGLMWGAAAAAASTRANKLLVHVVHKPESISQATFSADARFKEKFREHREAVIREIDESGDIAMSTLMLAPNEAMHARTQELRPELGRMFVIAEGDGRANETLEGFVNGTVAAMDRAVELTNVVASTL
jgi:cobaltochelatase CobT